MPVVEVTTDRHVRLLTLNRPEIFNALNRELMDAVADSLDEAAFDEEIRVVVMTGAGSAFCAGADVNELAEVDARQMLLRDGFPGPMFDRLRTFPKPVIAAVNGAALGGGCELVLACDIAVAARSARFALPEVSLGLIPAAGGTQRLVGAIGKAKAMSMLLAGTTMDSGAADAAGLVAGVVGDDDCLSAALELAHRVAQNAPLAVQMAKDAALSNARTNITAGLDHERRNFFLLLETHDGREGVAAFLEKRRPEYIGH